MSAPNLRQRKGGDATSTSTPAPNGTKVNPRQIYPYTRVLDVLRILITMFVFSSTLSYFVTNDGIWWGHRPQFTRPAWIMTKLVRPSVPVPSPSVPLPSPSLALISRSSKTAQIVEKHRLTQRFRWAP